MLAAGVATPLVAGMWARAGGARAEGAAAVQPPTIEEFVRRPTTLDAALSPDGHQIAVLHEQPKGDKQIAYVTLLDAANPTAKTDPIVIGAYKVDRVAWANNDRLLIWISVERREALNTGGAHIKEEIKYTLRRLVSVDRAGNAVLMLDDPDAAAVVYEDFHHHRLSDLSRVIDLLPDDPDHILMMFWDPRIQLPALHKVEVATGNSKLVEAGVDNTFHFETANGVPVLRWDELAPKTQAIYARPVGGTDWKLVRKIRITETDNADFRPVCLAGDDPNQWLVLIDDLEKPISTAHTLDLKTLNLGDAAGLPLRDIEDIKNDAHKRYFASLLPNDRNDYDFADKTLAGHYRAMNKFFDNQCNVDIIDWNADRTRLLAFVQGPTEAGVYYFYDRVAHRFDALEEQRPWLRDRLAAVKMLDVKTRDGVAMRAYLTVPMATAGTGPRPLIVMPHGGPEAHDTCDYDVVAQAFAARGWMVLQPNFRGSTGYGVDFALAGRRHWGDRMQEDVEDAVAQVIASGRVDPKRVAIWGGSYGGYAALMGAIRRPDLYKAVVSLAGVCDLIEFLSFERRRGTEDSPAYQFWRAQMGDPATDMAAIAAASPRRRVKEIAAPVLLMHGDKDDVVDPNQSRMMAEALKAAGKTYDYVVLKDEGHHFADWKDKTTALMLTRSVDFLAKALA